MQPDPFENLRLQEANAEKTQDRVKAREHTEAETIKWLMGQKRARKFIYGILERAGVWRLSFHTNALQMAFNEGVRNEGLALLAKIQTHCPELQTLLLKESKDE